MMLPPFGARIENELSYGKKLTNDIYFYIGEKAWEKARAFSRTHSVLLLPQGHSPYRYRWPVSECSVLIFDTSGCETKEIERLAYCLFCFGAKIIRVIQSDQMTMKFVRQGVSI